MSKPKPKAGNAGIRERIVQRYFAIIAETGAPASSLPAFCAELGVDDAAFHEFFPSLEAIEDAFWTGVMDHVLKSLAGGLEWPEFTARQRLLTFLFAFLENAADQRALLQARFGAGGLLARPEALRGLEARFKEFAAALVAHGVATGEIADRGRLAAIYPEALYFHFRSVIDFSLKDVSPGLERTDAFIEKTVHLAFETLRAQAFDAAFDVLRFLVPSRSA